MGRPHTLTYNKTCCRTSYHIGQSRTYSRSSSTQVLLRWPLLCYMAEGIYRAASIDCTLPLWRLLLQIALKNHSKSVVHLSTLRNHHSWLTWSNIRSHADTLYLCCWRKRWPKFPTKTCGRGHRLRDNCLMNSTSFTP